MNESTSPKPIARSFTSPDDLSSVLKSHTQQGFDELHSSENQDRHCFCYDETRHLLWMGVFDGHSGSCAAEFLSENILRNINRFLSAMGPFQPKDIEEALRKGIALTEEDFQLEKAPDGACVLLVCLSGRDMVVANLGDSRALLGRSSPASSTVVEAYQLTNDHNASNPVEALRARFRFLKNRGVLQETDQLEYFTEEELIRKVKEIMDDEDIIEKGRMITTELTRSFGDFPSKRICHGALSSEPEFTIVRFDKRCEILLLASDGIWATLTNQVAVQMAYDKIKNLSSFYFGCNSPAQQIVEEAVARGSGDDQTCLILNVRKYLSSTKRKSWNDEDESSPLLASILDGVFFSNRGTNLGSILTSSATRPFPVKLAELNRKGGFISSSEPTVFDETAKVVQGDASAAHKHTKSTQGRAGPPLATPALTLFEERAARQSKERLKDLLIAKEEVGNWNNCSREPSIFEEEAKRQQASASDVHLHVKSKVGRAGPPVASPELGLHETRMIQLAKDRTKGDIKQGYRRI